MIKSEMREKILEFSHSIRELVPYLDLEAVIPDSAEKLFKVLNHIETHPDECIKDWIDDEDDEYDT